MRQAIEQRGRELFVARKYCDGFGKGDISGDARGAALIADVIRLKRSSPPARPKGTKPSSSMMRTSASEQALCRWVSSRVSRTSRADEIGGASLTTCSRSLGLLVNSVPLLAGPASSVLHPSCTA
jgi:hypothetical protein